MSAFIRLSASADVSATPRMTIRTVMGRRIATRMSHTVSSPFSVATQP